MNRVGIITQARMTSSRLPGKVLKEINNIPLLQYHINRLKTVGYPIIVATTARKTDDPIVTFCKKLNYSYYRGDEENVLERYYHAAKENNLDIIVRVTSDCPLIDGNIVKDAVSEFLFKNDNMLYVSNGLSNTFPRGFDFEIFSFKLLKLAYENVILTYEKEHVTPYFYSGINPSIRTLGFPYKINRKNYRLTVDTEPDFELVSKLIVDFDAGQKSIDEIINIMDENPQLQLINSHVEQKKIN